MADEGRHIVVQGIVQGVGFRPWVYRVARAHGVRGWVRNDAAGVTIQAFGPTAALDALLRDLASSPPPAARIQATTVSTIPWQAHDAFTIAGSAASDERRVSIPADLPTCPDCLADIRDPANRRYRYPFTNCTNCGPRFTIARDVPYDRPTTTMAAFEMCPACQAEYDDPADRRFHAQPNACPACGPRLQLVRPDGSPSAVDDPIDAAAHLVHEGGILAVKGLGGFHLACDAASPEAVATLRLRKRRDEKPLAVMVADLAAARAIARLTTGDEALLQAIERPIVLVERRPDSGLAANVAPGNPMIGVMLPYTPLHHLLLGAAARPLVMTSGNLSDEPIAVTNDEALARLGGIADAFLLHDRDIDTRCDDSVARLIAGAPVVLRRSRGHVPRAIPLATPVARPVLACGALLKNAVCLAAGDTAYLGPHIGDLENVETYDAYQHAIDRLTRFVGIVPEVIACDRHPDYLSTRYALARPAAEHVAVQHHHAHIVSTMAERGVQGPVIGLAFDGTGLGTDGTAWGGEFLVATPGQFDRVGTFRPIPLAGGDTAIRQPWRQALAVLLDAFDGDAPLDRLPLFRDLRRSDLIVVRQMLEREVNLASAHGVGRYFDAAGALGLARPVSRFEGQVAMEWNFAADPTEDGAYAFELDGTGGVTAIDLRPAFRQLTTDLVGGVAAGVASARFHNTIAAASAAMVRGILARVGALPVVLGGGVFQNARLTESLVGMLSGSAPVFGPRDVPPGDGGLALGQAVIADAVVRDGRRTVSEDTCA